MPSEPYHMVLSEIPLVEELDGAIRRTALEIDSGVIHFVWLKAGDPPTEPSRHDECDQTVVVVSGRTVVTLYDADSNVSHRVEVGPGSALYIPRGVEHNSMITEDLFAIEVFSPSSPAPDEFRAIAAAHQPGVTA